MGRLPVIVACFVLMLVPALVSAQGAAPVCAHAVTLRDGRIATRAPDVEPAALPWVPHLPREFRGGIVCGTRGEFTQRAVLELHVARAQLARTRRDDPGRPGLLMRIADLAYDFAQDRAARDDSELALPGPRESACDRAAWQLAGWLAEGARNTPERRDVMTHCALAREALEIITRDHSGSASYDGAALRLVSLWLDGHLPDRAEAMAAALAARTPRSPRLTDVWFMLGDYYDRHQRHAEAVRHFERSLRESSDEERRALVRYRLGLSLLDAGDPARALVELSTAARQPEANGAVQRWATRGAALAHGALHLDAGAWSSADSAEWLRQLAPSVSWAEHFEEMLELFAARGRRGWALEGYRLLLGSVPSSENVHLRRRYASLVATERPRDEAIAELTRLVARGEREAPVGAWRLLYRTAARWHREALQGPRPDAALLRDAVRLYDVTLSEEHTYEADRDSDVPPRPLRAFYRAEALFETTDDCEAAYLTALSMIDDARLACETRCKAALCRARVLASDVEGTVRGVRFTGHLSSLRPMGLAAP